jgi:hypothetical protein
VKVIGVGSDDTLVVQMKKNEWAQLCGYSGRDIYERNVSSSYTGRDGEIEEQLLNNIRWMRSFQDSVHAHMAGLLSVQGTLKKIAEDLGPSYLHNSVPSNASKVDKQAFSGDESLRRIVRPPKLAEGLDLSISAEDSFDLYPCPNSAIERKQKELERFEAEVSVVGGGN